MSWNRGDGIRQAQADKTVLRKLRGVQIMEAAVMESEELGWVIAVVLSFGVGVAVASIFNWFLK